MSFVDSPAVVLDHVRRYGRIQANLRNWVVHLDFLATNPLGPAVPLVVGGLALVFLARWRRPQWHSVWALGVIGLSSLLWFVISNRVPPAELVRPWDPVLAPASELAWRVDGWAALGGLLALCVAAIDILYNWDMAGWHTARRHTYHLFTLAAVLAICSAPNLLTLAVCWVLFEVTLFARNASRPQAIPAAIGAAGALLIWLALFVTGSTAAQAPMLSDALLPVARALLLVAVLWRIAAYPLHFWFVAGTQPIGLTAAVDYLLPAVAGLVLLGRIYNPDAAVALQQPVWLALMLMALLGTGLVAWLDKHPDRSLLFVVVNRITWAVAAVVCMPAAGPSAVVWSLLFVALGVSGLVVGLMIARAWGWRWPLGIAVLCLIGFPATVGFPVLASVVQLPTFAAGLLPGFDLLRWLLVILAEALGIAALLRHWPGTQSARAGTAWHAPGRVYAVRYLAGFVLFAVPMLAFGLRPPLVAAWSGGDNTAAIFAPLITQLRTLPWWFWVTQVFSLSVAFLLLRTQRQARPETWARPVAQVASLGWLQQGLQSAGKFLSRASFGLSWVLDGEGYIGWVILTALLIWLVWAGL